MNRISALKKKLRNYLRTKVLVGNSRECNICGYKSLLFLPYLGHRDNAQCVNCGSLERNRLLYAYLLNETKLMTDNLSLLHVAPDRNTLNKLKECKSLNYIYCDKFEIGYESAYPKGTLNIDITDLSAFKDLTFDYIICSHVLEHVPDDAKALKEFYRVLKPGGIALLMIPWDINLATTYEDFSITDPIERRKHFGQSDHVRIYGIDFTSRIHKSGFNLNVVHYINIFNADEIRRFGFHDEEIFVCKKEC